MTELSAQQNEAMAAIGRWYAARGEFSADPFRLFGAAGTGKTTMALHIPEALGIQPHRVQFGAYTGKAASVLRGKADKAGQSIDAGTLHSLVYKPVRNADTMLQLAQARQELAQYLEQLLEPEAAGWASALELAGAISEASETVSNLEAEAGRIGFEWNPDSVLAHDTDLLILDEVSMVDAKLASDIERFGVPVLVLGDPEQLEPIGGEGYYTNAAAADYALTEPHRFYLDGQVGNLATRIRNSRDRRLGVTGDDMVTHSLGLAMEHDQVLCWKNATRWAAIDRIRQAKGRTSRNVAVGDRVMCLTNNRDLGVFNGQQWDVVAAQETSLGPALTLRDDLGTERVIKCHAEGFQGLVEQEAAKKAYMGGKGGWMLATHADAITVHKAQGSGWKSVYVVNEVGGVLSMADRRGADEAVSAGRRWLYTAVTRAEDRATVTLPRRG